MQERLIELLLNCLHWEPGRISADDLAPLTCDEWDGFLSLAAEQRIRPLLYQRLKERGLAEAVPERVLSALQAAQRQTLLRTMRFQAELANLARTLAEQKIPLIALKGIWLAQTVYGNLGMREMNDIDVLVRRAHLPAGAEALAAQGLHTLYEGDIGTDTLTMLHLPRFVKADGTSLELHWNLCSPGQPYFVDTEDVWQRAVPTEVAGTTILGLSPEDLLLHLCLHTSYQHEFVFGLRPSCDIAAVIERYEGQLDWGTFVERALKWRWQRGVSLALRLAADLVGASVPPAVLSALQVAGLDNDLLAIARQQIFTKKEFNHEANSRLLALRQQQGLFPKIAYTWRRLLPPPATMRLLYGLGESTRGGSARGESGRWLPLYYMRHIGEYIQRYSIVLWKRAIGDDATSALWNRRRTIAEWLSNT